MKQVIFSILLILSLNVYAQDSSGVHLLTRVLEDQEMVTHVRLSGDYAYVATSSSGLAILDVSDPSSPSRIDRGCNFTAYSVTLAGDFVYLLNHYSGLGVVNVSNPDRPFRVNGRYRLHEYCWEVEVFDDLTFLTGPGGIYIIDVSNVDSLQFPNDTLRLVGFYRTPNNADGLAISGHLAYYTDYTPDHSHLGIVDITDPTSPYELSEVSIRGNGNGVAYSQGYAYVASGPGGLYVFDVSDPTSPDSITTIYTVPHPWAVVVSGDHLYVTSVWTMRDGFWIFDISDLENIREVGHYMSEAGYYPPGEYDAYGIAVRNGIAYVAETNALGIYDCSDALSAPNPNNLPLSISLLSAYPNPFNSTTSIAYSLPASERVTVKIFDLSGRGVATLVGGRLEAGNHNVYWNGLNTPSGVYICRMEAGSFTKSIKLALIR